MEEKFSYTVGESENGLRTDKLLALVYPEYSRTFIQELIRNGRVTVGGKTAKASLRAAAGEEIEIVVPEAAPSEVIPQKIPLDILYEDDDIIIVNKPKGLAVHPSPGHPDGTLVNGLLWHCGSSLSGIGGIVRPGIVHRIDKNTTGSLIICKNDSAHRCIAEQLKEHSITRIYNGIVCGSLKDDSGTVRGAIGRSPKDRKKMAVVENGGKPAVTHYRVLERYRGYTMCEFQLETGRTHQIRVHMASIGHPLLGDDVYGPAKCAFSLEGQTLHAATIGFRHPSTGLYMEFSAPLPAYFKELMETLRKTK